jgi:capsular polysaccharide transport system permease protein
MSATYIHTKRKPGFSKLILRFFTILYLAALAASIVYLWLFTQDRFVSSAAFKVSKQGNSGMDAGLVQLALPGLSDSGSMDSQITIGYIDSADLLISLEKEFHLLKHYSSPLKDYFFRLDADANLEKRLTYYRSRISAHYNKETGMTEIHIDTFSPELSRDIAATLLRKSEDFINVINQEIADQQLGFVRSELERANQQVMEANNELLTLQNQHNFIRPDEVISANLKAVEAMKMEHLRAQAELSSLLRDSPSSPRIETTRSRLRSLGDLIEIESGKLSGPEKDRLNQLLVKFQQLEFRIEFANRLRAGAEAMLERNRVEAVARSRFFTVIQHPYLPEDVAIPRRPYATATILVLGGLMFLIFRALVTSVFERA